MIDSSKKANVGGDLNLRLRGIEKRNNPDEKGFPKNWKIVRD